MALKFSVVTCTWNSEPYLAQSIASVLAQDYPDFEYIFVDGGSTDGTMERIGRIPREVKFVTGIRGGICRAMNEGVRLATGDVIAHMHSDDYYLRPDVLADVAKAFERSGAMWVFGRIMSDIDGRLLPLGYRVPTYSYDALLRANTIPHAATFVRKAAFDEMGGFDERIRYAMDYDMWLRLGRKYAPVQIDKPLAAFRRHSASATEANRLKSHWEDFRLRIKYAPLLTCPLHAARFIVRSARIVWHRRRSAVA